MSQIICSLAMTEQHGHTERAQVKYVNHVVKINVNCLMGYTRYTSKFLQSSVTTHCYDFLKNTADIVCHTKVLNASNCVATKNVNITRIIFLLWLTATFVWYAVCKYNL